MRNTNVIFVDVIKQWGENLKKMQKITHKNLGLKLLLISTILGLSEQELRTTAPVTSKVHEPMEHTGKLNKYI